MRIGLSWRANARSGLFQTAQANPGGDITRAESHLSTVCKLFKETESPLSTRSGIQCRYLFFSSSAPLNGTKFRSPADAAVLWSIIRDEGEDYLSIERSAAQEIWTEAKPPF